MAAAALPSLSPDLYAHPVLAAVLHEALTLLGEGVAAERIEAAATRLSWTASPLWVIDALGLGPIDAALHASTHHAAHSHHGCCNHDHGHDHHHGHHDHHHAQPVVVHKHAPGQAPQTPAAAAGPAFTEAATYVIEKMAHGFRRKGCAAGAGFYDYAAEPPQLWSGLKAFVRHSSHCDDRALQDRLQWCAWLAALTAPAAVRPAPAELVACLGANFPGTRALALAQIRLDGEAAFLSRAQALAQQAGARFAISAAQFEHAAHG